MLYISIPREKIDLTGIYAYTDKVRVWLMKPLPMPRLKALATQCGSHKGGEITVKRRRDGDVRFVDIEGKTVLYVHNDLAFFNPRYVQQLQLNQPSNEVILELAKIKTLFFNYLEESLDWTFDSPWERDEAFVFVRQHVVKTHHGKQRVVLCGDHLGTFYSGSRKAPNVLAIYKDRPSKETGELYCIHWDMRTTGRRALERRGILSLRDVVGMNRKQLWEKIDLRMVRKRELGRRYLITVHGMSRSKRIIVGRRWKIELDVLTGGLLFHAGNQSTQGVIDLTRRHVPTTTFLQRFDNRRLLPENVQDVPLLQRKSLAKHDCQHDYRD
jgi:hypothetical protein